MATISPSALVRLNELVNQSEYSLANGDDTDTLETDELAAIVIVSNVAMEIRVPGYSGAYSARPPTGSTYWIEPTATLAGMMHTILPPKFFVKNNSGGAGTCSIYRIQLQQAGAVPAPA